MKAWRGDVDPTFRFLFFASRHRSDWCRAGKNLIKIGKTPNFTNRRHDTRGEIVGSVVKKRRKKMRKHKQRKLLKRQRHKK